jgi:HEAT repeat protein/PBS lyase HEAT-like repeat-containing protein
VVMEIRGMHTDFLQSHFPGAFAQALAVARSLQRPASKVKRLVENTPAEPEWRVRLENLRLLAGTYPHHPATREALHRGCQDERPEVRLQSALGLDDETGRATLLEVASHEESDDPLAARAVMALGPKLPLDRAQAILGHALRVRHHETAHACLEALGQHGSPEVVEILAKVMRLQEGELALAAARALGACGAETAEAPLLEALEGDEKDLRLAAAQALGRVGSAAAVLPLKESAQRHGGLGRAVRQAIAEIQSRVGASPGQVSLAGDGVEAGKVSLAEDEPRGRVSIAKAET